VTRLFELREAPLSLDECFAAVQRPEAGGVAIFIGTVRNQNQGQDVARLEYQAYPSMAQKELGAIARVPIWKREHGESGA
jgi:molybdopterin synthase catalytic subunit